MTISSRAGTGGLIVVGDTPEILDSTEGGFRINCQYTPARLYELSKMDGAIILSEDAKTDRPCECNTPSRSIYLLQRNRAPPPLSRYKFAKQTDHIVLSVSQSRNTLTLYLKNQRYTLSRTSGSYCLVRNQTMLLSLHSTSKRCKMLLIC